MKPSKSGAFLLVGLVLMAGVASSGHAQSTSGPSVPPVTTTLAHESVATSGARSPGNMVSAGIASAQNAVKFGRTNAAQITQTAPEEDTGFFSQIRDMLQQVMNNLLLYFVNLFLERAGLPPVNGNFNSNSNTNTNTNDNSNDNSNDNNNANSNDNSNDNTNANTNDNSNSNTNANSNRNDNTSRPGGLRKDRRG